MQYNVQHGCSRTNSPEKLSSFSSFLSCFFSFLYVLGGFSIHLTSEVREGELHVGGFYGSAPGVFIASVCIIDIGQNSVTRLLIIAGEAGKCNLAVCPERRDIRRW